MMMCREAARLITASYQRPLRWREQMSLRMHLAICHACRNFKKQMNILTEAARRFALQEEAFAGLQLADDARQRIRTLLVARQGKGGDA
ncbi:MAG: zf-HC2 domain-containing protein [Gammaproteobacteria bacterium]|jgi:predicted anti-sigma-YlaC factor YlaD